MRKLFTPLVALLLLSSVASWLQAAPLLQSGDRIVFIGDSITGQGGNGGERGWVGLIGGAMKEAAPANHQTLVPLGGSGQTVGGWTNVERKSRTAPAFLDVKAFDVQAELNQHADVVVIMLGMNDVLSPSMKDAPDARQKWIASYRSLIAALRERTTPRLVALATPTPCTEDPSSPKNEVMDKMVEEIKKLAAEEKCVVLPTRATAWEVLAETRRVKPDTHIAGDQVHPNNFGHLAIAAGMLKGLGEDAAAKILRDRVTADLRKAGAGSPLSYEVDLVPQRQPGAGLQFRIRSYHSTGKVKLELPEGWSVKDAKEESRETVFVVDAVPDRLVNRLVLRGGGEPREILIPAPWLVGTGNIGWTGWKSGVFDREAGRLPTDEIARTGTAIADAMAKMELKPGVPVVWKQYVGGVNYGGAGAPGVLDFAAVTYFSGGEVGYGLRWIQSDRERSVVIKISKTGFAGTSHLETWLNGDTVYAGDTAKAKGKEFPVKLKAGWNLLSFKSNFQQWQWQFAIDLQAVAGDTLDGLRYSSIPR